VKAGKGLVNDGTTDAVCDWHRRHHGLQTENEIRPPNRLRAKLE
jgi:hypothetical protein